MVDVVVRHIDPLDVDRVDQAEHVLEPLLPVRRRAGVDDHRLLTPDDERVEVHEQRLPARGLDLLDQEGLGRDLERLEVHGRSKRVRKQSWRGGIASARLRKQVRRYR